MKTGKLIVSFALISAMLPSIPTILKYWKDNEMLEIPFIKLEIPYQKFLIFWVILSAFVLIIVWRKSK
jgi:hypothetical protein